MSAQGIMRASGLAGDHMNHGYTTAELQRAWRAVATHYAARVTALPVEPWQTYSGPIDVVAIANAAKLPDDDRDHARAWRVLRADFELQHGESLFSGTAAA